MIFFTGPCSSCKGVFQHQILARCHGADQKTSRWKAVIPTVHSEVTEGIAKDPAISDDRDNPGKNERDCHDEVTTAMCWMRTTMILFSFKAWYLKEAMSG